MIEILLTVGVLILICMVVIVSMWLKQANEIERELELMWLKRANEIERELAIQKTLKKMIVDNLGGKDD